MKNVEKLESLVKSKPKNSRPKKKIESENEKSEESEESESEESEESEPEEEVKPKKSKSKPKPKQVSTQKLSIDVAKDVLEKRIKNDIFKMAHNYLFPTIHNPYA